MKIRKILKGDYVYYIPEANLHTYDLDLMSIRQLTSLSESIALADEKEIIRLLDLEYEIE